MGIGRRVRFLREPLAHGARHTVRMPVDRMQGGEGPGRKAKRPRTVNSSAHLWVSTEVNGINHLKPRKPTLKCKTKVTMGEFSRQRQRSEQPDAG